MRSLAVAFSSKTNDKFTNESSVTLPTYVEKILDKGPKCRAPPALNRNLSDELNLQLETFSYKLRWNET